MAAFNHIGIVGRYIPADPISKTLQQLCLFLEQRKVDFAVDTEAAKQYPQLDQTGLALMELASKSDLVIVVGGDGTLLHTARQLAGTKIPILGINLGHLGFLVDVLPDEMEKHLDEILAGNYRIESRSLLTGKLITSESHTKLTALNDVIVHKGEALQMIDLEIHIDGHPVSSVRGDGLIISTPTGSTAYALSAGGPLLDPELDAIAIVPICPHALTSRPLVLPAEHELEIRVTESSRHLPRLNSDGLHIATLEIGNTINIKRFRHRTLLLHPQNYNHYDILRKKLHWGLPPESLK